MNAMLTPLAARGRGAVVLLAEDDEDHALLAQDCFAQARPEVRLHRVGDGEQVLRYLRHQSPYENAPAPDLVLLDLHMPRLDGDAVLEEIGRDEALKAVPVVVLTTSAAPRDVERMYRLGCRSYLTKPADYLALEDLVRRLADYWFEHALLPPPAGAAHAGRAGITPGPGPRTC